MPTYGLVSRCGIFPLSFSLDTAGPMAWTVEDNALMLEVLAGHGAAVLTNTPVARIERDARGGLAIHAAARYGCRVTTTTISDEQFRYARDRVHAAGLDEHRARDWVVVRMVLNAHWAVQDAERAGRDLDAGEREWITRCIAITKAVQD